VELSRDARGSLGDCVHPNMSRVSCLKLFGPRLTESWKSIVDLFDDKSLRPAFGDNFLGWYFIVVSSLTIMSTPLLDKFGAGLRSQMLRCFSLDIYASLACHECPVMGMLLAWKQE
jgi:hypothetical protein